MKTRETYTLLKGQTCWLYRSRPKRVQSPGEADHTAAAERDVVYTDADLVELKGSLVLFKTYDTAYPFVICVWRDLKKETHQEP